MDQEVNSVQAEAERLQKGWGAGVFSQAYQMLRKDREDEVRAEAAARDAATLSISFTKLSGGVVSLTADGRKVTQQTQLVLRKGARSRRRSQRGGGSNAAVARKLHRSARARVLTRCAVRCGARCGVAQSVHRRRSPTNLRSMPSSRRARARRRGNIAARCPSSRSMRPRTSSGNRSAPTRRGCGCRCASSRSLAVSPSPTFAPQYRTHPPPSPSARPSRERPCRAGYGASGRCILLSVHGGSRRDAPHRWPLGTFVCVGRADLGAGRAHAIAEQHARAGIPRLLQCRRAVRLLSRVQARGVHAARHPRDRAGARQESLPGREAEAGAGPPGRLESARGRR